MDTPPATATLRVWPTLRLGLLVIKRRALAIVAIAVTARFLVSQAASGVDTFAATTFSFPLTRFLPVLVFFGSMLVMWLAVVPLTIQALETPVEREPKPTAGRTWRAAVARIRAIMPGLFVRALGLLLVNYALVLATIFPLVGGAYTIDGALLLLGAPIAAFAAWASLRWTLAFPVLVVEGLSLRDSLRRSWQITRSQATRLLGLLALTVLLAIALTMPIAAVTGFVLVAVTDPSGDTYDAAFTIGTVIGQIVALVVYAPILTACYQELRGGGRTATASDGPP